MNIKNKKIILITGTSKGIGKYLAEYYCGKGHVVTGCSRNESEIKNDNYTHFLLDVTDGKKVKELFLHIRKNYDRLDVLINNAGIASMNHVMLTPSETVKKIFETNFTGTFLFCREAAKLMSKNKSGRIINFSSVAADLAIEGEAIYAASKSAVETFTKILSKELSAFGITANTIGLTPVKTDLIKNVPVVKINNLLEKLTVKRFAEFTDISNITDFFIREESNFITGQHINLGGV